jgi:hypothetical protein
MSCTFFLLQPKKKKKKITFHKLADYQGYIFLYLNRGGFISKGIFNLILACEITVAQLSKPKVKS